MSTGDHDGARTPNPPAEEPRAGRTWSSATRLSDGRHVVDVRDVPTCVGVISWLAVRREDGTAIDSWEELQRVKNEIAGLERLAVECYPPQSAVINAENIRHLWVLPPGWVAPMGMALASWVNRG